MPATFTPTREPMAQPRADDPDKNEFISFAGNITGPELGEGQSVFAEFAANRNQLDEWEREADGGKAKLLGWLKRMVDERYFNEVTARRSAGPPPPPPESVPMKDLAALFGTPKGRVPVLVVEETHIDKGTDPADDLEDANLTGRRSLFGRRKRSEDNDKATDNKKGA